MMASKPDSLTQPMTKKNTKRGKKPKKNPRKKNHLKTHLIRAFIGIGVLIILVVIAAVTAHYIILRKHPIEPILKPQGFKTPRFEIYPKEEIIPRKSTSTPTLKSPERMPRIAIIIDDAQKILITA